MKASTDAHLQNQQVVIGFLRKSWKDLKFKNTSKKSGINPDFVHIVFLIFCVYR